MRALTLDRPERRNSLSSELVASLIRHLEEARNDRATRVVVLTGTAPAFCAGADLQEMREDWSGGDYVRLLRSLDQLGKPSIAKVRGYAIAGGVGLVTACTFAVCDEDAWFSTPEIHRDWNLEIFRRFNPEHPKYWGDSLFAQMSWIWHADSGSFAIDSWHDNPKYGRMPILDALEAEPRFDRGAIFER